MQNGLSNTIIYDYIYCSFYIQVHLFILLEYRISRASVFPPLLILCIGYLGLLLCVTKYNNGNWTNSTFLIVENKRSCVCLILYCGTNSALILSSNYNRKHDFNISW